MRKREESVNENGTPRPQGALTDHEAEEVRQAYRDGCQGEIIIGLRGKERVVTMLLSTPSISSSDPARVRDRLRKLGCDRFAQVCISDSQS